MSGLDEWTYVLHFLIIAFLVWVSVLSAGMGNYWASGLLLFIAASMFGWAIGRIRTGKY
ncbi:membrane protein [Arthrobacter phage Atuin]|nr:membrane protein [Arthrobacter phage Atuin]